VLRGTTNIVPPPHQWFFFYHPHTSPNTWFFLPPSYKHVFFYPLIHPKTRDIFCPPNTLIVWNTAHFCTPPPFDTTFQRNISSMRKYSNGTFQVWGKYEEVWKRGKRWLNGKCWIGLHVFHPGCPCLFQFCVYICTKWQILSKTLLFLSILLFFPLFLSILLFLCGGVFVYMWSFYLPPVGKKKHFFHLTLCHRSSTHWKKTKTKTKTTTDQTNFNLEKLQKSNKQVPCKHLCSLKSVTHSVVST